MKNSKPKTIKAPKPRNPVVLNTLNTPKRNAGRHGLSQRKKEADMDKFMVGEVRAIDAIKMVVNDRPWENEPNYVRFKTESRLWAEVKRHPTMLHLCGYLHIPKAHPVYTWNEGDIERELHAYGGITYNHKDASKLVLGFDCAHADDFSPGVFASLLAIRFKNGGNTDSLFDITKPTDYKTIEFVKKEIQKLDKQVEEALNIWILSVAKEALRSGAKLTDVFEKKGA